MKTAKLTDEERLAIDHETIVMYRSGREEEAMAMFRAKVPLEPWLAKIVKEKVGADFLRKYNYNLTEAEEAFGPGWLDT